MKLNSDFNQEQRKLDTLSSPKHVPHEPDLISTHNRQIKLPANSQMVITVLWNVLKTLSELDSTINSDDFSMSKQFHLKYSVGTERLRKNHD